MLKFKKYSSIENAITRDFMERVKAEMPVDLEWVVQEKVDGSNTSFLCNGNDVGFAKRTSVLANAVWSTIVKSRNYSLKGSTSILVSN